MQVEWKASGWVPKGEADELWRRFRNAVDAFFAHRTEYFKTREREELANLERKRALVERAERLAGSTDWKSAGDAIKSLQAEWKTVGPVPKEYADRLWGAFRAAQERFFERRQKHHEHQQHERVENLRRKRSLISKAESLSHSTDWKAAGDALKALQAEWKTIGPVPREQTEELWQGFRSAQDVFYSRRSSYFEQRDRERAHKQAEWRSRMQEVLSHKREQVEKLRDSIEHDIEVIQRWRDTIDNLRPGSRADEIRESLMEKIASVSEKVDSKQSKVKEVLAAIREIEGKLDS